MKIKWLGHSSFLLTSDSGVRVIFDPYKAGGGMVYKPVREAADLVLVSHEHSDHNHVQDIPGSPEIIRKTGHHEVQGIAVDGVLTCHDNTGGRQRGLNTVFCVAADNVRVCHLGDLGHELSAKEIAAIGKVDVLLVPTGGYYTIDAQEATRVCAALKPKVVMPMHYKVAELGLPIAGVEEFLKGWKRVKRLETSEVDISPSALPETTEVWVLEHAL